jgi:hypothetical protein
MTHPITPPPELVQQWVAEIWHEGTPVRVSLSDEHIATRAAQWGADQELEACCKWLDGVGDLKQQLRAARRPKPPSLKEQALMALEDGDIGPGASLTPVEVCIIRRALEALPDD